MLRSLLASFVWSSQSSLWAFLALSSPCAAEAIIGLLPHPLPRPPPQLLPRPAQHHLLRHLSLPPQHRMRISVGAARHAHRMAIRSKFLMAGLKARLKIIKDYSSQIPRRPISM